MIVPLEPSSVRKKTLCNILYFIYILSFTVFLCENVSKAIDGQPHCLAIISLVIVACF